MRAVTDIFALDGQGILVPDGDVTVTYADVEGESLRDISGMLHRAPLRRWVKSWEFRYDHLTQEEQTYMLSLLRREAAFAFTHPGDDGKPQRSVCCCRGWSADFHDAARGYWRNFRFRVEEV